MAFTLGSERISSLQRDLLKAATAGTSLRALMEAIHYLATDFSIEKGEEDVHPSWIELIEHEKARITRYMPEDVKERLEQILAAAKVCDPAVATIDPETVRISFLLGAGASKPAPSSIPTVRELLPDLLTRARRLDREEVAKVADFCETSKIDNIEDLLTAAQLSEFCTRNPAVLKLVEFLIFREEAPEEYSYARRRRSHVDVSSVAFLQDTLQVLFGLLSSRMLPADPNAAHDAIVTYLRRHPKSPVVTTNYDCCIDRAMTKNNLPFSYCVDFANPKDAIGHGDDQTPLLKLHGSLNWFYCETCQEVHWIDIEQTVRDYNEDRASYPVVAICRTCGGQRRGLLVPPLAMKFDVAPPLNPLIDRAGECFQKSDLIVVVGFSFADADLYISRMISKAMQASERTRLLVFDPEGAVARKMQRKFSIRIPNFDPARVMSVRGDCADTLPQFLAGALHKPAAVGEGSPSASPSSSSGIGEEG